MELTEEQKRKLTDHDALIVNQQAMHGIIQAMKEIPELPSEKPVDIQALTRVEFPERFGVLTYMEGFEYPYKGFPFFEFVDKIDYVKKIQRGFFSSLYHSFKRRSFLQKATLICVPWLFHDLVVAFVNAFHRVVVRFLVKHERYSDAVRELHRVFSTRWHDEDEHLRDVREKVRDIVCMFLEFDNAYRFRFQDIAVELDKDSLKKNPVREIVRLFTLMQEREKTQEIKDTWSLVITFLPWFLRFDKGLRNKVVGILSDLDTTKIALSVEDKQFCEKRKDYQFGYQLCQQQIITSVEEQPSSVSQ